MKKSFNGISLLLGAIVQLSYFRVSEAILPTSAIDVHCDNGTCDQTLLASQAFFGSLPEMSVENNLPMIPISAPADDPLLCLGSATITTDTDAMKQAKSNGAPFVIVAPRGQCTFESKALAAQNLGASAIIITGNLASRYSLNETTNEVVYPAEYHDYDCDKATAYIPTNKLSFDVQKIPYDWELNDPVLSGTAAQGNLCAAQSHSFAASCPSEKCLLTGKLSNNGQTMKACCAWDKHIYLYSDKSNDNATTVPKPEVNIPALYITMGETDDLFKAISTGQGQITVTLYRRYYPQYNLASIIIWALGVFVAAIAAWLSASEYRSAKFITQQMDDSISDGSQGSNNSGSSGTYERVAGGDGNYVPQEESLELNAWHAIGFIVFSTMGLLILFIFKIYNVVKIFYAFGCSSATFQVIFFPLFYRMAGKLGVRDRDRIAFTTETLELGDVTYVQILAAIASYGLGTVWTVIAFTQRHPDAITFFWVTQDIFGAAMCVVFLSTMKLNSIRVASVLLSAAFFYDIFFVFVTPLLTKGGKSIMVDVATSGGAPTADPAWCEKYPDDKDCQGGDPLPMLLTVPRIFDYSGGSSLLGLGDIVLPGLLLSFAARYDEAKRFIGSTSRDGQRQFQGQNCTGQKKGYFPPLVVAYAIGLAMANIAVYAMQMGQPALLYLVPCCLGTMIFLGWKRGELNELWNTPKILASCDEILYGPLAPIDNGNDSHGAMDTEDRSGVEVGSSSLRPIT